MKRKPIQQFEMSFTAQTFNLASQETADGQRITAEREQSARDRAQSEARQAFIGELSREMDTEESEVKTVPGLAPGSRWTVERRPMAKALATMQGGLR